MNKTLNEYVKTLSNDDLYNLWDLVISEMNQRKNTEVKEAQKTRQQQVRDGELICKNNQCLYYRNCDKYNCLRLEPADVDLHDDYVITS